jgi:hypothetical protein
MLKNIETLYILKRNENHQSSWFLYLINYVYKEQEITQFINQNNVHKDDRTEYILKLYILKR